MYSKIENYNRKRILIHILHQLIRYFFASLFAAIVDFSLFLLCYDLFSLSYLLSNTIAFAVGVSINYTLSIRYVFVGESSFSLKEFIIFTIIGIFGYGISQLTLFILIDLINIRNILELICQDFTKYDGAVSKICAIGATFSWNFIIRKSILFNPIPKNEKE